MSGNVQNEALIQDIKGVVENAEDLLAATEGQTGDKINSIRARLKENIAVARSKVSHLEEVAVEKAKETARATDDYVHENPWKAVGVAAGVGIILGMLIGRK